MIGLDVLQIKILRLPLGSIDLDLVMGGAILTLETDVWQDMIDCHNEQEPGILSQCNRPNTSIYW